MAVELSWMLALVVGIVAPRAMTAMRMTSANSRIPMPSAK
jgi:hypothetical protein